MALVVKIMPNVTLPAFQLINDLSKQLPNEFMVSVTGFKPPSVQHGVTVVSQKIKEDKAGYALGHGYFATLVFPQVLSQIPSKQRLNNMHSPLHGRGDGIMLVVIEG